MIQQAVHLLKQSRLVAFPTETVYGLGADATNPSAIARIYKTKGRPSTNPLIIHVADIEHAQRLVIHWPAIAQKLAEKFWPGPLTLVLPKHLPPTPGQSDSAVPDSSREDTSYYDYIPDNATAHLPTVALRVPAHPLALQLLKAFDGPLAAPSANRSTRVSPTTAQHVRDEFPLSAAAGFDSENEPALILDGGPCTVGIESTVLDLTTHPPRILRPGHITAADLEPILGPVELIAHTVATTTAAASPGQHDIHYAPTTPAYRFETPQRGILPPHVQGQTPGLLLVSPLRIYKEYGPIIAMPHDPTEYAQHVYAALRKLDALNLPCIFVELPPDSPEWRAIRDRLTRATQTMPPDLANQASK